MGAASSAGCASVSIRKASEVLSLGVSVEVSRAQSLPYSLHRWGSLSEEGAGLLLAALRHHQSWRPSALQLLLQKAVSDRRGQLGTVRPYKALARLLSPSNALPQSSRPKCLATYSPARLSSQDLLCLRTSC